MNPKDNSTSKRSIEHSRNPCKCCSSRVRDWQHHLHTREKFPFCPKINKFSTVLNLYKNQERDAKATKTNSTYWSKNYSFSATVPSTETVGSNPKTQPKDRYLYHPDRSRSRIANELRTLDLPQHRAEGRGYIHGVGGSRRRQRSGRGWRVEGGETVVWADGRRSAGGPHPRFRIGGAAELMVSFGYLFFLMK